MIQRLSHATIYVLDQDSAYDFYVNKLGFTVATDATIEGGFRWLTVSPPGMPGFEIVLMKIAADGEQMTEEEAEMLRTLVKRGKMGAGVFSTPDIHATYEEMKAKGVEFTKPPTKEFYGTEALFKDDSGNWFSLGEAK